jgi:hypothetical protein
MDTGVSARDGLRNGSQRLSMLEREPAAERRVGRRCAQRGRRIGRRTGAALELEAGGRRMALESERIDRNWKIGVGGLLGKRLEESWLRGRASKGGRRTEGIDASEGGKLTVTSST